MSGSTTQFKVPMSTARKDAFGLKIKAFFSLLDLHLKFPWTRTTGTKRDWQASENEKKMSLLYKKRNKIDFFKLFDHYLIK